MKKAEFELVLVQPDDEKTDHEKLMASFRELNQKLDVALERIRKRRAVER